MFPDLLSISLIVVASAVIVFILFSYFLSRTVIHLDRQPVPKTPQDYDMSYQNVDLQPVDGIKIKGWLIPGANNKLIVMTHVGGLTKYG